MLNKGRGYAMKTMRMIMMCGMLAAIMIVSMQPVRAEAMVLSAGQVHVWGNTLNEGDTWYFEVYADDVAVMVMDDANYEIYESGGQPYVMTEYSAQSVSQKSFIISGVTGEICICVVSNNLLSDQTINYQSEVTRYNEEETPGFELPLIITATLVAMATVAIFRKKRC